MRLEDARATEDLGKKIAGIVENGVVIALIGDLGSGKTTLSKAIVKNILGEDSEVTSPTFNIVNEYISGKNIIYHFDLYRLEDESELYGIGFDDYIGNKKSIIIIEWADKFENMLPKNYIRISFTKNENNRDVEITSVGSKLKAVVDSINDI